MFCNMIRSPRFVRCFEISNESPGCNTIRIGTSTRKDKEGNHWGESQVNELANDDHIVEKVRSLKCVLCSLAV